LGQGRGIFGGWEFEESSAQEIEKFWGGVWKENCIAANPTTSKQDELKNKQLMNNRLITK
jgi:hypothetical protein